jgi:hypothetical protein
MVRAVVVKYKFIVLIIPPRLDLYRFGYGVAVSIKSPSRLGLGRYNLITS